jgi:hypothetical protein
MPESRSGYQHPANHECWHTFASLTIAVGVNARALSTYMGHANISITVDRCGHLTPSGKDEAAPRQLLGSRQRGRRSRQCGASCVLTGSVSSNRIGRDRPRTPGSPATTGISGDVLHLKDSGLQGVATEPSARKQWRHEGRAVPVVPLASRAYFGPRTL